MGVLECSRYGCNHIMCDRYSSKYGYICDECFEELVSLGVNADIEEFMNTAPVSLDIVDDAYAFFNEEFEIKG